MIESPCIKICEITETSTGEKICSGCLRTMDELKNWRVYSDVDKLRILEEIEDRKLLR